MGQYEEKSILFLDIRGFTLFFNQVYTSDPEQTARLLKDTWEILTEHINRYSGKVDKIMGDGIMVLFDNSLNAFEAAWHMMFEVARIDEHLNLPTPSDPEGWLGMPFQVGVGIEEGLVGIEKVSIQERQHELVIGIPVIIAARLADKARPMTILVGENAYRTVTKKWNDHIFQPKEVSVKHDMVLKCWEVDMNPYVYE